MLFLVNAGVLTPNNHTCFRTAFLNVTAEPVLSKGKQLFILKLYGAHTDVLPYATETAFSFFYFLLAIISEGAEYN